MKKDSINAASVINGTHPKNILSDRIAPSFRDTSRGREPGKSKDAPNTSPAVPSIIIESISIVPCCQIVKNDSNNSPFL